MFACFDSDEVEAGASEVTTKVGGGETAQPTLISLQDRMNISKFHKPEDAIDRAIDDSFFLSLCGNSKRTEIRETGIKPWKVKPAREEYFHKENLLWDAPISTYALIRSYVLRMFSSSIAAYSCFLFSFQVFFKLGQSDIEWSGFSRVVIFLSPTLPLVTCIGINLLCCDYIGRSVLYYRLWERKLLVDFKDRYEIWQMIKSIRPLFILIVLNVLLTWFYCFFDETMSWPFYLSIVFLSSQLNYSLFEVLQSLFHIESTFPGFHLYAKSHDQKLEKLLINQMTVKPEQTVKYDCIALSVGFNFLQSFRISLTKRNPSSKDLIDQKIDQALENLKTMALWTSELENDKNSVLQLYPFPSLFNRVLYNSLYAYYFVYHVYDDNLWHNNGTFGDPENHSKDSPLHNISIDMQRVLYTAELAFLIINVAGIVGVSSQTY